jgi:hypothetical protein
MTELTKTVTQSEVAGNAEARSNAPRREEVIRTGVLAALGSPAELLRVSVLPLWGDKFRVNVWTAGSAGAAIPNSYFVTADQGGAILKSEPPIRKQY